MKTKLISISPDAEKLMSYTARVSNPANQDNPDVSKLLAYCAKNGHWSVFELAHICIEIVTSRAIAAQILRHRSFSFQEFCIDGESLISCQSPSGAVRRRKISDLFALQNDKRWSRMIRVYDESKNCLVTSRVKEVFKTGSKECFELELENGKKIISTADHKFLTRAGFARLGELESGVVVACNGVHAHQNLEWMSQAKIKCLTNGTGVRGISLMAGIGYHTARKWLKIHGLQFTKKETASYSPTWNKGLPTEDQPRFGKSISEDGRSNHRASAKRGCESNLHRGGTERSWRQKVATWQESYRLELLNKCDHKCKCGSAHRLEIDHVQPVSSAPELAFDKNNLQIICKDCHRSKSVLESRERLKTIWWSRIKSITPVGKAETYDLEVEHRSHNYVANGIVTHNSQRYAIPTEFETYEARRQDTKNRQNSIDDIPEDDRKWFVGAQQANWEASKSLYDIAIKKGIAKECARFFLPLSTQTTLYMTGSVRSWIHYLQVRTKPGTQLEHLDIAEECKKIFAEQLPNIAKALEWV